MTHRKKPKTLAIVGGGRWARVFISTLSVLNLPYQLTVISTSNAERLATVRGKNGSDFTIIPTVDHLLEQYDVEAAVVVNAARLHNDTASRLVEAGVSVLIEKPLALHKSDVERLYASAAESAVHVAPSLIFLHCSYLHNFAHMIQEQRERVVAARLEWSDPGAEIRYGEDKAYDPGISIAQDVMPHVWAVLASTLGAPDEPIEVQSCVAERGGRWAVLEFTFSGTSSRVVIERDAQARRRCLAVEFTSGWQLTIDFSTEPGTITLGSDTFCGDPDWDRAARPVLRQLQAFLALLGQPTGEASLFEASIGSVVLAESSDALLKQHQRSWLATQPISSVDDDVAYAICEIASPELYRMEKILPGDRKALTARVEEMMRQLRTGNRPVDMDWLSAFRTL